MHAPGSRSTQTLLELGYKRSPTIVSTHTFLAILHMAMLTVLAQPNQIMQFSPQCRKGRGRGRDFFFFFFFFFIVSIEPLSENGNNSSAAQC